MQRKIELLNNEAEHAIKCPLTLDPINVAARTSCGHLFEEEEIKLHRATKNNNNRECACPVCCHPITAEVPRDPSSQGLIDVIKKQIVANTKQADENANLLKEIAMLRAQLAEKDKTIKMLMPTPGSKTQAMIPPDFHEGYLTTQGIRQEIADLQREQARVVFEKSLHAHFKAKKLTELGALYKKFLNTYKQFRAEHTQEQARLSGEIKRLMSLYDPQALFSVENKNMSSENNPITILSKIEEISKTIRAHYESGNKKMREYRDNFEKDFILPYTTRLRRDKALHLLDATSKELQGKLQFLHTSEQTQLTATLDKSRQRAANTLSLFGGTIPPQIKQLPKASPEQQEHLHTAVETKNIARAKKLLTHNSFNLEQREQNNQPLLKIAIDNQDEAMIRLLISNGANPNVTVKANDQNICLPLLMYIIAMHHLTEEQRITLLTQLLDAGADTSLTNQVGSTALHWAASQHDKETILLLLARKADPLLKAQDGCTPYGTALRYLETSIEALPLKTEVTTLLKSATDTAKLKLASCPPMIPLNGAPSALEQKEPCKKMATPEQHEKLMCAVESNDFLTAFNLMDQMSFNLEFIDKNNDTLLHWAAYHQNIAIIQLLLDHGANVLAKNGKNNRTPLEELNSRDLNKKPLRLTDAQKQEAQTVLKNAESKAAALQSSPGFRR